MIGSRSSPFIDAGIAGPAKVATTTSAPRWLRRPDGRRRHGRIHGGPRKIRFTALPDSIPLEVGALVEPMSVAYHAAILGEVHDQSQRPDLRSGPDRHRAVVRTARHGADRDRRRRALAHPSQLDRGPRRPDPRPDHARRPRTDRRPHRRRRGGCGVRRRGRDARGRVGPGVRRRATPADQRRDL